MACFEKSQSLLPDARDTLQQAINETSDDPSISPGQRAVTHSNMSAVLSAMKKHEGARRHAKLAVGYCKQDLKRFSESTTLR
jgi:hypothetical protein